jgi:DNA-binding MarR family transcriptional regulator
MSFASTVTVDGSGAPPTDPPNAPPTSADLVLLAERIASIRSVRKEILPSTLFGEPGWDMMLALYVASMKGQRLTVTNVCDASDAPSTTALRWLDRLVELDMVRRLPHPTDLRVIFIELAPAAGQLLETFLSHSWSALYPPQKRTPR